MPIKVLQGLRDNFISVSAKTLLQLCTSVHSNTHEIYRQIADRLHPFYRTTDILYSRIARCIKLKQVKWYICELIKHDIGKKCIEQKIHYSVELVDAKSQAVHLSII